MSSTSITVTANGRTHTVTVGHPLHELIADLGQSPERVVVERNGEALTPGEAMDTILQDGDRLEIVRIVAGG